MEQFLAENIGKLSPSHLLICLLGYAIAKLARKVESDEKDKFIRLLRRQIRELQAEISALKTEIDDLSNLLGVSKPNRQPRSGSGRTRLGPGERWSESPDE